MKTLCEIEERSDAIRERMNKVLLEIAKCVEGNEGRGLELAEELSALVLESKMLNTNLVYFREMAEQLINSPCSGPH
jgi:hypothetical protein